MKIIGAGMAGLIAGHMLRRHNPIIVEASNAFPNNHSALLRFRTNAVSNATSIPFEKVRVRKGVVGRLGFSVNSTASIPDMNAYAQKVTGSIMTRSIGNTDSCDRWVAPDNFIEQLGNSLPCGILFSNPVDELTIGSKPKDEPWISTIPMPLMMKLVGWQSDAKFEHQEISTVVAEISAPLTSVYQTVYIPHNHTWGKFYRASIHGSQLIIEGVGSKPGLEDQDDDQAFDYNHVSRFILHKLFGIEKPIIKSVWHRVQRFGKIIPIDDQERKRFIIHLTDNYNIYSLGRFATWRPILLDDVVGDISVIDSLLGKTTYAYRKA